MDEYKSLLRLMGRTISRAFGLFFVAVLLPLGARAQLAKESIVLLPIGLVHVNGAYGSVWESELIIKDVGQSRVDIGSATDQCSFECPFGGLGIEPKQALDLIDRFGTSVLARPEGILLRLRSRSSEAADLRFNFRIRDLSRQESTWGTELPVVSASAFTPSPLHLLNLPTDARFRFTVRVYAIEGEGPISGRARFYELRSGALLREIPFMLQRFGTATYYPAYAQLDSLSPALANLGIDPIGVEIVADAAAQKLWAFATVTNNDSQHVTTITPQPAP